jgi:hypothetical protein
LYAIGSPLGRGYEEFCLQGYNMVWSSEIQMTFQKNISRASVVFKNKARKNPAFATCCNAGFLLDLFVGPEEGRSMFLRNVDLFSTDYTALYTRK